MQDNERGSRLNSFDDVLSILGVSHSSVIVQLLTTLALIVLGIGALENTDFLPIPIDSCWNNLDVSDLRSICSRVSITPIASADANEGHLCSKQDFVGLELLIPTAVRILLTVVACICFDVFGRRRCAVFWTGTYFIFSLSRSFAPNDAVTLFLITAEMTASQAAILALLLVAAEGSTQKECTRSVCLVLLGHSIGATAFIPLVNSFITDFGYRQLIRGLPSVAFVLLVLKCIGFCGSDGSSLKMALKPIVFASPLLASTAVLALNGFAYGSAVASTMFHEINPYNSLEDRVIAFGVVEFILLLLTGLLLSRLPCRKTLPVLMALSGCTLALLPSFYEANIESCAGDVILSCLNHGALVITGVWLIVSVVRLTPTHSRGSVLGLVVAAAMAGRLSCYFISEELRLRHYLGSAYLEIFIWAPFVATSGLVGLCLPGTPQVLPDNIAHVSPDWYDKKEKENTEDEVAENARL